MGCMGLAKVFGHLLYAGHASDLRTIPLFLPPTGREHWAKS